MKNKTITTLLGALCAVTFFAGCWMTSSTNDGNCGPDQQASVGKTITATSDEIYVESGSIANSSSTCPASFHLFWDWANPARALTDSTLPPLIDLKHSFHVNSDNLSFSDDTPLPTRTHGVGGYSWSIEFEDHNTGDTAASNYYIKTYLGSSLSADSVSISARVNYYKH
jgi:hypothetical protein